MHTESAQMQQMGKTYTYIDRKCFLRPRFFGSPAVNVNGIGSELLFAEQQTHKFHTWARNILDALNCLDYLLGYLSCVAQSFFCAKAKLEP